MDPEIAAMGTIAEALAPLDADAVRRVLKWAIERYQQKTPVSTGPIEPSPIVAEAGRTPAPSMTFLSLHDLFDAANADTGLEKVLTVAYWFQALQGNEDWDSQTVNSELRHLGYPSTNITRDLDVLQSRSPKLVLQVKKQGTTKQARKRYRLTREGIKAVESMVAKTASLIDK